MEHPQQLSAAVPGTFVTSNTNKHAAVFQSDWHKWGQNGPNTHASDICDARLPSNLPKDHLKIQI